MPDGNLTPLPPIGPDDAGHSAYKPRNKRRILCLSPQYAPSFGTFQYSFKLLDVQAFMPPQGLLLQSCSKAIPHSTCPEPDC